MTTSATNDTEQRVQASAVVIPFPKARVRTDLTRSTERLTAALGNLAVALSEQRAGAQRWSNALEDLKARMQALAACHRPT